MNKLALELEKKILAHEATIGVIGLGYVGLPLVKTFLGKGFPVIGFDVDQRKVDMLNHGKSYIRHISTAELKKYLSAGKFQASSKFARLKEADAVIICVPTPARRPHEPGHVLCHGHDPDHRRARAAGPAHRSRKHDLSRDDRRGDEARPREGRP